jgi:hypothetical protein
MLRVTWLAGAPTREKRTQGAFPSCSSAAAVFVALFSASVALAAPSGAGAAEAQPAPSSPEHPSAPSSDAASSGAASSGAAESSVAAGVRITGSRVRLLDVLSNCPENACSADLGPAPPAGTSRIVDRASMRSALQAAGANPALAPAHDIRVISVARTWTPKELAALLTPLVEKQIPPGMRLLSLEPKASQVLPLLANVGECQIAALPRRSGTQSTNVLCDFMNDGSFVRRVPVVARVLASADSVRPKVPRGAVLTLVIERPMASVSAHGVALKDANPGETAPFRVQPTGHVVLARIESESRALVVEEP